MKTIGDALLEAIIFCPFITLYFFGGTWKPIMCPPYLREVVEIGNNLFVITRVMLHIFDSQILL